MNIPLKRLNEITDTQLPAPGSINFKNCHNKIEIPLFHVTGWIELAVENDHSGMKSGGHEFIKQQTGTLVFIKGKDDWELLIVNDELKARVDILENIIRQVREGLKQTVERGIKEGKTLEELQYSLTGVKPKKKRKKPTG